MFFAPAAPHGDGVPNGPATPAPRHKGMFAGTQAPRTPSFNEADVSDKPPAISSLPLLTAAQITAIDSEYQTRIESLQAVDEAVESIINKLAALGQLEDTYLIFVRWDRYYQVRFATRDGDRRAYFCGHGHDDVTDPPALCDIDVVGGQLVITELNVRCPGI